MKVFGVDYSEKLNAEFDNEWREQMLRELGIHSLRMQHASVDNKQFWQWFSGEADSILRGVADDDRQRLHDGINRLLHNAGLTERYPPDVGTTGVRADSTHASRAR